MWRWVYETGTRLMHDTRRGLMRRGRLRDTPHTRYTRRGLYETRPHTRYTSHIDRGLILPVASCTIHVSYAVCIPGTRRMYRTKGNSMLAALAQEAGLTRRSPGPVQKRSLRPTCHATAVEREGRGGGGGRLVREGMQIQRPVYLLVADWLQRWREREGVGGGGGGGSGGPTVHEQQRQREHD
jgi:hypothetical protein